MTTGAWRQVWRDASTSQGTPRWSADSRRERRGGDCPSEPLAGTSSLCQPFDFRDPASGAVHYMSVAWRNRVCGTLLLRQPWESAMIPNGRFYHNTSFREDPKFRWRRRRVMGKFQRKSKLGKNRASHFQNRDGGSEKRGTWFGRQMKGYRLHREDGPTCP